MAIEIQQHRSNMGETSSWRLLSSCTLPFQAATIRAECQKICAECRYVGRLQMHTKFHSLTAHIHILSARFFMCMHTYIHMRELMHNHVSCVSVFVGIFRENAWIHDRADPFPCAHAKSCLFRISLSIYLSSSLLSLFQYHM